MFGKPEHIKEAEKLLGLHEITNTTRLDTFLKQYSGWNFSVKSTPWCAAFVNAILGKCGFKTSGSFMARSLLKVGKEVTFPKKGDIVVFSRGRPPSGHVAFYMGNYDSNHILVLGGNQNDEVCIKAYGKSRILGYRRPVK